MEKFERSRGKSSLFSRWVWEFCFCCYDHKGLSRRTGNGRSNRLTVRAAQLMIKNYAAAFGKATLTMHKLRHSFATNHYKINKDLAMLKEILNHANVETTMIYTYISNKQIEQSINKADRIT